MFRASRSLPRPASMAAGPGSRRLQAPPRPFQTLTSSPSPRSIIPTSQKVWQTRVSTTDRHVLPMHQNIRYAGSSSNSDKDRDKDKAQAHKEKVIQDALKPRPSEVSTTSSVRASLETAAAQATGNDGGALNTGLKHDIGIVKDTFRLSRVPRESHFLGLAGTVPYLVTSVSTLYLSWDLNRDWPTGSAFYDAIFTNHDTARYLLNLIEPIQLGYGAVIISFLGAIHWGLEYAEKSPHPQRTRFRYGMGVLASVVAWPTIFMPIEYALTTQFAAFVALYFADSRATSRGWAPPWYSMYRFLLTAMVGIAIFLSLVGRAKLDQHGRLTYGGISSKLSQEGIADHQTDWAKLEAEEKEKIKKEKKAAERKAKREAKQKEADEKKGGKSDKGGDKEKSAEKSDDKSDEESEKNEESSEQSDSNEDDQDQASEEKDSESDKGGDKDKKSEESDNNGQKEEKKDADKSKVGKDSKKSD